MTCSQTCLAMVLGVPVEKVIEKYGDGGLNQLDITAALYECGVTFEKFVFDKFIATGWYLAKVPSLNNEGGNHEIVIHFDFDMGCSGFTVFDPNQPPKKVYLPDGSNLKAWSSLIYFLPGGTLKP